MKTRMTTAVLLAILVCLYPVSCTQRKQSPPETEKKEEQGEKGFIIFIDTESPGKDVLYRADIKGKKKEKIYDKDPYFAAGYNEKIAFMSRESGKHSLNMINADGKGLTTIISDVALRDNSIAWSPDGRRLVFMAREIDDKSDEIYYVEAGEYKIPIKATSDAYIDKSPRFTNDGKSIVYTSFRDKCWNIMKYSLIDQSETSISSGIANDISPTVSHDGTKIFFLSDEKEKDKYNLYMMDMEGKNRTELTKGLNIVSDTIKISPDSSMISFVTIDERNNSTVQVIDMNKSMVMVSDDSYLSTWSGDSKMLYYSTFDPKNRKIVQYDVIGKSMSDIIKIEYKPGEGAQNIRFLHFTDKIK